jgi:hypothetical protein
LANEFSDIIFGICRTTAHSPRKQNGYLALLSSITAASVIENAQRNSPPPLAFRDQSRTNLAVSRRFR